MRFGVNYTPRSGWFHSWLDFSADETARDLDAIAELGVDHVRVFPLWPLFQPNRTLIRTAALDDLDTVLALAADRGLDVSVDGLQGHLSSFDFLPSWLSTWHRRNMFTDAEAISGQAAYLTALARRGSAHANFLGMTVGNEVNQFAGTIHPDSDPATPADIDAWLETMIAACRAGAPGRLALHSCYDATWYDDTQPFTPEHAARAGDLTIVHSWVFNGTAQRYGAEAFETRAHARYLVEIARAYQLDPHRQVWAQELGAPRNVLPQESVPGFIEHTVAHLADAPDLYGITWWCSHDVDRSLADFPDLEYSLGLIDQDGRIKAEGVLVRDAIAQARSTTPSDRDRPVLEFRPAADGGRAALGPGGAFFTRYMDVARGGVHPVVRVVD